MQQLGGLWGCWMWCARPSEGAREMGTETENEETANCLGTEGGGEKIRVSIGDGHLDRESEAGRAASERRIAKTKARAERG